MVRSLTMPLQASLQVVSTAPETLALPEVTERAVARGKFLYVGDEKLWIKGVTYGTFRPDGDGNEYPPPRVVRQDFGMMVASGFNAVRTYTVPPHWLLDMAADYGLRVMVGLPWEQHVTFLEKRDTARSIEKRVRQLMRDCKGHPAVLCYTIGNEIPAAIVRWHGRRKIEDFLLRLYTAVKEEDPTALVTYVNFPTTEYLQLPFLDFVCFNVYLESKQTLQDYLARLHNLSGDRPVVMAEIGFDSQRNGEEAQALVLDWQIQTIFEEGCCGAFVFAWTDEWYRGGHDIEDWDFGLTRRDRSSKLALDAVSQALAQAPFPQNIRWPRISVVVCSCNGEPTIRDTMEALQKLEYPEYEVIVIDDGSTDRLAEIVSEYAVTLISTENRGLSNARNTGMEAASGEIIAYTDDDAYPDPHWLHYLALTFLRSDYVGVGGPNLAPPGDGWAADCVANAPGGPVHVLLCDRVAEHIPGCNMAFKKEALMAIGGFDPRYRAAGDDVDVCWRLQEQGWIIGFSPAAIVWHHRRNSLRAFWRQQLGYGKAEALLEEKWPQKYNALGHVSWGGRMYGKGITLHVNAAHARIYQGVWGSAPFQSIYEPAPTLTAALPLMPEWYLLTAALGVTTLLAVSWTPLIWSAPLLGIALGLPIAQAVLSASKAEFTGAWCQRLRLYVVTAFLHLQQPIARLIGRFRHGLTPWRRRGIRGWARPVTMEKSVWREEWEDPLQTLDRLEKILLADGMVSNIGDEYDRWDIEARAGPLGRARLLMVNEEHGAGRQMLRFRVWPKWKRRAIAGIVIFAGLSSLAALDGAWLASAVLGAGALTIVLRSLYESATATKATAEAIDKL